MRQFMLSLLLTMLAGCAGGNFQFADGTVVGKRLVTEYHPNGQIKSQGYVGTNGAGVEVKTDQWQWWFDNGQQQWQGFYANGTIDAAQLWKEWNRNGSLRDTSLDL